MMCAVPRTLGALHAGARKCPGAARWRKQSPEAARKCPNAERTTRICACTAFEPPNRRASRYPFLNNPLLHVVLVCVASMAEQGGPPPPARKGLFVLDFKPVSKEAALEQMIACAQRAGNPCAGARHGATRPRTCTRPRESPRKLGPTKCTVITGNNCTHEMHYRSERTCRERHPYHLSH